MLGCFRFSSKGSSPTGTCLAHVFAMHVAEELDVWPESTFRTRKWVGPCCRSSATPGQGLTPRAGLQVPVSEASCLCRHDWMRQALSVLVQRERWSW